MEYWRGNQMNIRVIGGVWKTPSAQAAPLFNWITYWEGEMQTSVLPSLLGDFIMQLQFQGVENTGD